MQYVTDEIVRIYVNHQKVLFYCILSSSTSLKAAVFRGPGNISLDTRSMSQLRQMMPGGTILKVRTCSVCGYDVRVFHYGHKKVMAPVVLGHEICAETTESVGS